MPTRKVLKNRHPVDRLSDLREQIKALQAEADFLKDDIIRSGDFVGSDYVAVIKETTQNRLDRAALEDRFGQRAVAECCKEISFTTLSLSKKAAVNPGSGSVFS